MLQPGPAGLKYLQSIPSDKGETHYGQSLRVPCSLCQAAFVLRDGVSRARGVMGPTVKPHHLPQSAWLHAATWEVPRAMRSNAGPLIGDGTVLVVLLPGLVVMQVHI